MKTQSLFKLSTLSLCIPFLLTACGSGGGSGDNRNISNNSTVEHITFEQVKTPYSHILNWGNVPVVVVGKKLNSAELKDLKDVLSFKPDDYTNKTTGKKYKTAGGNYSRIVVIEGKDPIFAYTGKPTTEKLTELFGRFSYKGKSYTSITGTTSVSDKKHYNENVSSGNVNLIVDFNNETIDFSDNNGTPIEITAKIYQDGKNIAFKGTSSSPFREKLDGSFWKGTATTSVKGAFMGMNGRELVGELQSNINAVVKPNSSSTNSKGNLKMKVNSVFYAEKQ